jgi:MFS superfamily sulfate permease-like transporter
MDDAPTATERPNKGWRVPLFQSVLPVGRSQLMANLAAGVSLAALNIPQAMGYAKIAGMPIVTGLYTLLFPLLAFAAFGSSRYLVVASDSATAAILAGGLVEMAIVPNSATIAACSSPCFVQSVGVVALVLVLHSLAPRVPAALIAVVGAIVASALFDFSGHGIRVIGSVAGGLPHLSLPVLNWTRVHQLLPIAGSCFLMIVAQSAVTARAYAAKHHQVLDQNRDLVGISAANVAAALSGAFVVNGSPTQTAMVETSGGSSQLAHLSTALVVMLVLLLLTVHCSSFQFACWVRSFSPSRPSGGF